MPKHFVFLIGSLGLCLAAGVNAQVSSFHYDSSITRYIASDTVEPLATESTSGSADLDALSAEEDRASGDASLGTAEPSSKNSPDPKSAGYTPFVAQGTTTYTFGEDYDFIIMDLPVIGGGTARKLYLAMTTGEYMTRVEDAYVQVRHSNERTTGKFLGDRIFLSQLRTLDQSGLDAFFAGRELVEKVDGGQLTEHFQVIAFGEGQVQALKAISTVRIGSQTVLIREYVVNGIHTRGSFDRDSAEEPYGFSMTVYDASGDVIDVSEFQSVQVRGDAKLTIDDVLPEGASMLDFRFNPNNPLRYPFVGKLPSMSALAESYSKREANQQIRSNLWPGMGLLGVAFVIGGLAWRVKLINMRKN